MEQKNENLKKEVRYIDFKKYLKPLKQEEVNIAIQILKSMGFDNVENIPEKIEGSRGKDKIETLQTGNQLNLSTSSSLAFNSVKFSSGETLVYASKRDEKTHEMQKISTNCFACWKELRKDSFDESKKYSFCDECESKHSYSKIWNDKTEDIFEPPEKKNNKTCKNRRHKRTNRKYK